MVSGMCSSGSRYILENGEMSKKTIIVSIFVLSVLIPVWAWGLGFNFTQHAAIAIVVTNSFIAVAAFVAVTDEL
jgi:hypothetical protein